MSRFVLLGAVQTSKQERLWASQCYLCYEQAFGSCGDTVWVTASCSYQIWYEIPNSTNLTAMWFSWIQFFMRKKGLPGHEFPKTWLHLKSFPEERMSNSPPYSCCSLGVSTKPWQFHACMWGLWRVSVGCGFSGAIHLLFKKRLSHWLGVCSVSSGHSPYVNSSFPYEVLFSCFVLRFIVLLW